MRLSRQGQTVLEALFVQEPSHRLPISRLTHLTRPVHSSLPSTRASLSRTLRRLWRAGLVELKSDWGVTLSDRLHELEVELAAHEGDVDGAYADILAAVARGTPGFFACGSADEYLQHHRRLVSRRKRHIRSTSVELSMRGREYVERLTSIRRAVNSKKGNP